MMAEIKKEGMLLVVLDILREENCHGYGIAEKIEKRYGIKRPGSGLIYPILYALRQRGFVRIAGEGKRDKKIYEISEEGRRYLKENDDRLRRAKRILKNLGEFHRMGGVYMMDSIKILIENMENISDGDKKEIGNLMLKLSKKIERATRMDWYE